MKKFNLLLALLLACGFSYNSIAQNKDYKWLFGFGTHGPQMTINDGGFFKQYSKINQWNLLPGIGKVWVDKAFGNSFTVGTQISIGLASRNPTLLQENIFFLDWDINAKYRFANGYILHTKCWFDPYVIGGFGLMHFKEATNTTAEIGVGTNLWITKKLGFNVQTSYNKAIKGTSYMHHALGLVVRLGKGPDKDKDGVPDSEDECPNEPGTSATNGCPDTDGDGILDKADLCPDLAGLVLYAGCPDTDGDGITDADDACPTVAGPEISKGCPDSDGDGVLDFEDTCPKTIGTKAMKGCPDKDGDGIADAEDKCPDVFGAMKNMGCPSDDSKKTLQEKINFASQSIQFEAGLSIISKKSYKVLDEIVDIMKANPSSKFTINGHTDNVGSSSKNIDLSAKRSAAVMNYFLAKGVSYARLRSSGYGDAMPISNNNTSEGRAKNRRVDILLRD